MAWTFVVTLSTRAARVGAYHRTDVELSIVPVGVRALASLPHARLQSSLESQVASVRTFTPKASEITREWWVIDAEGMVLGLSLIHISEPTRPY